MTAGAGSHHDAVLVTGLMVLAGMVVIASLLLDA
jgi:hypothetical protein